MTNNMASSGPWIYRYIYGYRCDRVKCDEEYTEELASTFGGKLKEYLKALYSIYDHANITGHQTTVDSFTTLGKNHTTLPGPSRGPYA